MESLQHEADAQRCAAVFQHAVQDSRPLHADGNAVHTVHINVPSRFGGTCPYSDATSTTVGETEYIKCGQLHLCEEMFTEAHQQNLNCGRLCILRFIGDGLSHTLNLQL